MGLRDFYGDGTTSLYEIAGVGHGIFNDGDTYLTPLTTSKGAAWSGTPIGIQATATGYSIITASTGKKGTSYSEYSVTSDGVVSKKGTKLTSLKLVGEEASYDADLNMYLIKI